MADRRKIFDRVKQATVALAYMRSTPGPRNRPFEILGSGVCVDAVGVIVTCRHVIEAFMAKSAAEPIAQAPESEQGKPIQRLGPVKVILPQVLFFRQGSRDPVEAACAPPRIARDSGHRDDYGDAFDCKSYRMRLDELVRGPNSPGAWLPGHRHRPPLSRGS